MIAAFLWPRVVLLFTVDKIINLHNGDTVESISKYFNAWFLKLGAWKVRKGVASMAATYCQETRQWQINCSIFFAFDYEFRWGARLGWTAWSSRMTKRSEACFCFVPANFKNPLGCKSSLLKPCVSTSSAGIPDLSLSMYPFGISTDEHVPEKFLLTKSWIK